MGEYATRYEHDRLREDFDDHIRKTEEGYERLSETERRVADLNAEIQGDERTGRLSLRKELTSKIEGNAELIEQKWDIMERRWKILSKVLVGIAIIAGGAITVAAIRVAAVSYFAWPWK